MTASSTFLPVPLALLALLSSFSGLRAQEPAAERRPAIEAQESAEVREAVRAFHSAWSGWDSAQRIREIGKLAKLGGAEAAVALASKLAGSSPKVKQELAAALGPLREPKSVPPLIAALEREQNEFSVFEAVCKALGEIGDRRAVPALTKGILSGNRQQPEWQQHANARLDAIGNIRHPDAVDELISLLGKVGLGRRGGGGGYGLFTSQVQRNLRKLTGQEFREVNSWRSWWKENKSTFRFDGA